MTAMDYPATDADMVLAGHVTPARALSGFAVERGGILPGSDAAAFNLLRPHEPAIPILLTVSHAGRTYPPEVTAQMREPDQAALSLEDRLMDRIGEVIAAETGAALLIAEAPRAMIDLNRAPDDIDWGMVAGERFGRTVHSAGNRRARAGLGLVPRRLARLGEVWSQPLRSDQLKERLAGIHVPFHEVLARTLADLRDRWGAALLIDLHSMPPLSSGVQENAQLVLGDRFGASLGRELASFSVEFLSRSRRVAHNLPYAGGYIAERHGAPRFSVHAVQLEVCRATYLDAAMRSLGSRHAMLARHLTEYVRAIADEVIWMGRSRPRWAAE